MKKGIGVLFLALVVSGFGASALAGNGASKSVLEELKQKHEAQEREKERLEKMLAELPMLTIDEAQVYAGKLAERLNAVLAQLTALEEGKPRAELMTEARTLMETASLLADKIDLNESKEERVRAYEREVERRRLPVKALFALSGLITTAAEMIKGRTPDVLEAFEEHTLEPYKVSEEEWRRINARSFIEAFQNGLGTLASDLTIASGVEGASQGRQHVLTLLKRKRCETALL